MPLKEKIVAGKFIILGEFEPPKGADFDSFVKDANLVKGRVDALVVPEMANAVLKASSLGGCACLESEGMPSVFQVCCRDRNRLALQADILSAAALGVKNIMAVNGVETRFGDHPQTRTVNDLNLIDLIETVQTLCQGKDLAGVELKGIPSFSVGSTIDAGAAGNLLDIEMEHLEKMLANGVDYLITNPVFDLRRFEQFVKRVDTSKIAVLPTVLLLKSAGMARYIDRNMRGITIPQDTIRRIQKAPDKVQECIRIAGETIKQVKKMGMAGVLVSTVGWESKLPSVLNEAQL
ncbi:MAG: methylenetetrahydrofolate reductase [Deltaproteobacteria bacterium]|jgi:5,10-methylenetetrahydrofolate reductase|nr:methylenetetrahydrofolate reductase [Deltaproteobacteria bacterium]